VFGSVDVVEICLEGDGLPPWCEARPGQLIMHGSAWLAVNGEFMLAPGTGMVIGQIPPDIKA